MTTMITYRGSFNLSLKMQLTGFLFGLTSGRLCPFILK